MNFSIGDLVTRPSYNNDTVFRITKIDDNTIYLKGLNMRLLADAPLNDLIKYNLEDEEGNALFEKRILDSNDLNRSEYFYLPGKILHIDGDSEYLEKCLKFYNDDKLTAIGIKENEDIVPSKMRELLETYNPNILVITGHDAYYKKNGAKEELNAYKNSGNFVKSIHEARKYEHSHEKLIIIAGACQSNYEELIKAGANFASSPKRINIHALDPAIIAKRISLSDINKDIDLINILDNTKYGKDGMGGIKTKGTMYIGYPR
jgi:spore coat assembly protein